MTSERTRMAVAMAPNRNVDRTGIPGLVVGGGLTLRVIANEWANCPPVLVALPVIVIV